MTRAFGRAARGGVNWFLWRPALDQRLGGVSPVEVKRVWTVSDVLEAHLALDALDVVEDERRRRDPGGVG